MNYSVELSENFKKEAKRLTKKYPSLKLELSHVFLELEKNPTLGTSLGNNIYKIRIGISSKGKGSYRSYKTPYSHFSKPSTNNHQPSTFS